MRVAGNVVYVIEPVARRFNRLEVEKIQTIMLSGRKSVTPNRRQTFVRRRLWYRGKFAGSSLTDALHILLQQID
jgi:hypothetical protein